MDSEDLAASLLRLHLKIQHDGHSTIVLSQDLNDEDRPPVSHLSIFSIATGKYAYPVPGCEGMVGAKYGMRQHFGFLHPLDLVELTDEGSYPKCEQCGIQVNPAAMVYWSSGMCKEMHKAKLQQKALSDSTKVPATKFFVYGV